MHSHSGASPITRWKRFLDAFFLTLVVGASAVAAATPDPAAAMRHLALDTIVHRETTLRDLGVPGPVVLSSSDSRRELFIPVPADLPLRDATLQFDASYLRGDGGRTTLVLSLDGYPVSARALGLDQGSADIRLGVDGSPRASGFVRLGVAWSSIVGTDYCDDERLIGNVLKIATDTRLTYSFDGAAISSLIGAWTALPTDPAILTAPGALSAQTYDTAWRIGTGLIRAGKNPRIRQLPTVGDTVDLAGAKVPDELRAIPGFAALAADGQHRLASPAEVGAYLMLGLARGGAEIAIFDAALLAAVDGPLNALAHEVEAVGPAAVAAFSDWRSRSFDLGGASFDVGETRLVRMGGTTSVAVASGSGAKAAALFSRLWRQALLSRSTVAHMVERAAPDSGVATLSALGGVPGGLDVLARGDWTTSFELGAVAADGKVPTELVIDVAASPGASASDPVATVFVNDWLLGAKRLVSNGQPERIAARIPAYALAPSNVLRVTFERQPSSDHCRETPRAFPVSVLPTSHVRLEAPKPTADFVGMIPRLSERAVLMVPGAYLETPQRTLPRVIRIAEATGISPVRADFRTVAPDAQAAKPDQSFLAFDLTLADARPNASVEGNRLILRGQRDQPFFDVSGLDHLALVQVLKAGTETGILWQGVGASAPENERSFRLARGNIALIGSTGPVIEIDSADPTGTRAADTGSAARLEIGGPQGISWNVPIAIGLVVLFFLLLARASWVRRQRSRSSD